MISNNATIEEFNSAKLELGGDDWFDILGIGVIIFLVLVCMIFYICEHCCKEAEGK